MVIVSSLSEKIKTFCDLYKENPLLSRLRKKYPNVLAGQSSGLMNESVEYEKILCFNDDWERSLEKLNMILEKANHLKEQYIAILEKSEENSVYFKTIDKLIKRLKKMVEGSYNAYEISDALSKAIQATIIKNFCCEQLESALNKFMYECGFKCVKLEIGKQIDDNDLDYIDMKNCLYVRVNDKKMHNTIIGKVNDAYVFKYYDSDEEEYYNRVIPGVYSIGSWKE